MKLGRPLWTVWANTPRNMPKLLQSDPSWRRKWPAQSDARAPSQELDCAAAHSSERTIPHVCHPPFRRPSLSLPRQGKKKNTLSSSTKPMPPLLYLSTTRAPSPSHAVALLWSSMSPAAGSSAPVNPSSSPRRAPTLCPVTKNQSHRRHSSAAECLPSIALTGRTPVLPTPAIVLTEHPSTRRLVLQPRRPRHRPSAAIPAGRAVPPWNPLL
jgi:hypothetical protein